MSEKPIHFSAPMVRAILDGRKTLTRRPVIPGRKQKWLKPTTLSAVRRFAPSGNGWWTMAVGEPRTIVHCGRTMDGGHIGSVQCPYGVVGDTLWVRETWQTDVSLNHFSPDDIAKRSRDAGYSPWAPIRYTSDGGVNNADVLRDFGGGWGRVRPSIHMPRWASRITLEITDVRVEQLRTISEDDARAEGVESMPGPAGYPGTGAYRPETFREGFFRTWVDLYGADVWNADPWVWVVSFRKANEK